MISKTNRKYKYFVNLTSIGDEKVKNYYLEMLNLIFKWHNYVFCKKTEGAQESFESLNWMLCARGVVCTANKCWLGRSPQSLLRLRRNALRIRKERTKFVCSKQTRRLAGEGVFISISYFFPVGSKVSACLMRFLLMCSKPEFEVFPTLNIKRNSVFPFHVIIQFS